VLGFAKGFDAGRVAEAATGARVAARAGALVMTASAVAPRRKVRIMLVPDAIEMQVAALQLHGALRKSEHQPFVERAASMASP
jgi:ketol-acid reductoisomerase